MTIIKRERGRWTARIIDREKTILVVRFDDYLHLVTFLAVNKPKEAA